MSVQPGTPLGIEGHRPFVPRTGGVHPWCECGYRWDQRDPKSELVGQHIERLARKQGVPQNVPGFLR